MMNTSKKIAGLFGWIILSSLAGIFGAQFKPGQWYQMLQKPSWTPPDAIFPIIWPVLYVLMGVAAWQIWKRESSRLTQSAFIWFYVQLILNALWSWLFFGKHMIGAALIEIILLWIAVGVVVILFFKKNQTAGLLLIPYLLWISFALALNGSIWQLN